ATLTRAVRRQSRQNRWNASRLRQVNARSAAAPSRNRCCEAWIASSVSFAARSSACRNAMPQVVIIGGGAMGASIAYHLSVKGVRDVVVLEKEHALAMGSTGRSVGGIRHQFSTAVNIQLSLSSVAQFTVFNEQI